MDGYDQACASAEVNVEASVTVWTSVITSTIIHVTEGDPFKNNVLRANAIGYATAMAFCTAQVNWKTECRQLSCDLCCRCNCI